MKALSLKAKLFSLVATLLGFIILLGALNFWSQKKITTHYAEIAEVNYPNTVNLLEEYSNIRGARIQLLMLIMPGTTDEQDKEFIAKMKTRMEKALEFDKKYLSVPFQEGEEELYNKFKGSREEMQKIFDKEFELYNKNKSEDSPERKEMDRLAANELVKAADELGKNVNSLIEFHKKDAAGNVAEATKAVSNSRFVTIVLVLLAIVFGTGVGILITNNLVSSFKSVSSNLAKSSLAVSSASTQIAASAEQLSQASTEQAASLQETSASIEEISSMINNNSVNAEQSAKISEQGLVTANRGKQVVTEMIHAMEDINTSNTGIMNQIDETNKEIEAITKIINEIGEKTKVINDIVFQTKLLSFNASVEAARAGEHGKGFAVVAEEVGNLASMSGNAALEISNMLDGSIKTVDSIVKNSKEKIGRLIENGKQKVEIGTRVANECDQVLSEIVESVGTVSKMASEIAVASKEQSQGVQEVTKAVAQLDQVTQQNASSASESANAAGTLSVQAEELDMLVKELVVTIEGGVKAKVQAGSASTKMTNKKFDFDDAVTAHAAWKHKLSKYIQNPDGSLKYDDVCSDNKCPLGKWIYSEGTQYASLGDYKKLKPAHAHFHKEAAEIVKLANSGKRLDENVYLGPNASFTMASKEVTGIILSLKNAIHGGTPKEIKITKTTIETPKQAPAPIPKKREDAKIGLPSSDDSRFDDV